MRLGARRRCVMNVKHPLWHSYPGYGADQLNKGEKIIDTCARVVSAGFRKMIQRSNTITIPQDARMLPLSRGRTHAAYSQARQLNWAAWVRGAKLTAAGPDPVWFGIGIYLPVKKELLICSEVRRIGKGPFFLRLSDQPQQVFLLSEQKIGLRSGPIFGGPADGAEQIPEDADLY